MSWLQAGGPLTPDFKAGAIQCHALSFLAWLLIHWVHVLFGMRAEAPQQVHSSPATMLFNLRQ